MVFVTTDGASNAEKQVYMTPEEEEPLLDIFFDPPSTELNDDGMGITTVNDVRSDDIFFMLAIDSHGA